MSDDIPKTARVLSWRGAHREPLPVDGGHPLPCLVGEDNPQSAAPEHALYPWPPGCAGDRLIQILGLTRRQHLALWRTNLCSPTWSTPRARERAVVLLRPDAPWGTLVLLGRKVAQAFERAVGRDLPAFSVTHVNGACLDPADHERAVTDPAEVGESGLYVRRFALVALPHPSGRNLVWNDRQRWLDARKLMQQAAPRVEWGSVAGEDR